jgi:hypothetical protein
MANVLLVQVAALDEALDFDDPSNILDDDFMNQVNTPWV